MAEELEAGTAYLQLMGSARGLQADVDKKVKKVKAPDIVAKIDAEITSLEQKAAKARATIASIREKAADPQIGLDIAELDAKANLVRAQLERLRGEKATPKVEADIAAAEAKLGRFESRMAALEQKRSTVQVDADIARFEAQANAAEAKIRRLESQRATVQISQDGAAATIAALDTVDGRRRRVDGSRASVSIAAAGGAQASGVLGAIVAGLAAVAAAAPAAVAGVGAVLGAASAGGQVLGAVKAGFSGIGDAIKSVESDEKSAATTSASSASSRSSSANQIASAQAAVTQAVMQANRAAITGGEQVADASRAQARAVVQAGRAQITASQQVSDARRAQADAVVSAASRTADAERSLGRAQDSVRYAQEALTRSRRDAVEANEDLRLSLSGTAIAERRAALNLRKAQAARDAGGGDSEELQLDVDEAAQNLAEVRERYGDLRAQQAEWARTGVAGNQQVVSATRSLADAQASAQDAARNLVTTQRDGARQIADAATASARAQQQAAWSVADAQDSVTDATLATSRAARDAAWAQQDAAAGVASAQRGLQSALDSTAESAGAAGAAGKQSAYDLAKLTPAGREYVRFWTQEWKPGLQGVTDTVAGELLPRIQTAQRSVISLMPELSRGLGGTAAVVGDLAIKGGQLATSGAFRRDFAAIMDSNNRSLASYGDAAISGTDSLRALTVAGLPLSERLARVTDYAMQGAESFLLQKESTGELGQAMELGAAKAGQLLSVGGDIVDMGYQIVVALQPVGTVVLDVVGGVAQMTAEFAKAYPEVVALLATMGIGIATVNGLAKATVALHASYGIATGGLKTLANVTSTLFVPSNLAATRGMQALSDWGQRAGLATSTFGAGLTRSATAGNVMGAAVSKTTGFVTKLGSSLPLIGAGLIVAAAGMDAMGTSTDEATSALAKGGDAAAKMRAELAETDAKTGETGVTVSNFGNMLTGSVLKFLGFETSTREATAALEEQRATMSNLERAQSYATEAQGNYEAAVRRFGAASPEATGAMLQLRDRTRDVEIAQIAVREKVDLATAAVLYQRDQLLGALDANLRARQAAQSLARDQQGLADAIKGYGAGSQEAVDAGLQLEASQLRAANAARDSAGGQAAYVQSIKDMVLATKGDLTPSLYGLVAGMDLAGLSAIGAKVEFDQAGQAVARFPDGKTVVLSAQTQQAMLGLDGVALKLNQVPGNKQVTVATLAADAEAKLAAIGFTVTHLPNGQVQITANDAFARGTLIAFQQFAAWQVANPQLAADPAKAYEAMRGFLLNAGQQTGVPMLDANPQRADQQVRDAVGRYNTTWSTMPVTSNPAEADRLAKEARDRAAAPVKFPLGADTRELDSWWGRFTHNVGAFFSNPLSFNENAVPVFARGGPVRLADGGPGGSVAGPGGPTADRIPAMLSDGEYVLRAAAVRRIGVPALDAMNAVGYARGGPVGYAAGGTVDPTTGTAAVSGVATVTAPSGDPSAAAATASATDSLTGSMTAASLAAATLTPELATLAATQTGLVAPATTAVTLGQQQLVSAGITPLVGALVSTLFPTLAVHDQQVGVAAVGANTALQGAQTATRLSTTNTALNTAANTAAMTASTTGMSLVSQAQLAGLRLGQDTTQVSTYALAANNAAQNNAMISSTGFMSGQSQGHLAALRGGHDATKTSVQGMADWFGAQMGRMVPGSADPVRWVLQFPVNAGLVGAWNKINADFALNKPVAPVGIPFAEGGVHEQHRAQITRAGGPTRIWSEPETGGEAYIPLAASKRPRSVGILREVASRFGMALAPETYADGGVVTFADGGLWRRLAGVAQSMIPGTRVSSSYRPGDPGYHGSGRAVDLVGNLGAINRALAGRYPNSSELIYTPGINIKNGRPHTYNPATQADHFDHVHWALDHEPQLNGAPGLYLGGGGGFFDAAAMVEPYFAEARRQVDDVTRFHPPSQPALSGQGIARTAIDRVQKYATDKLNAMFATTGGGGGNVEQWRGVVMQALAMTGNPPSDASATLRRMNQESGGNPRAINNWDVNAARGTPSKGLMQVIDPTFRAHYDPRTPNDIWNPLSNVVASMRYARSRYGSLQSAYNRAGGYDQGGIAEGTGVMLKNVMAPERVLSPVETRNYNALESTLGRNGMRIDVGDLTGPGPATFPDRVRLEARGLELRGDGLIDIIDGHLVGLAETINDGG